MSLPRSVNALRFSSLFGMLCSIYLCLAVAFVFLCNRKLVPNPGENFAKAKLFVFTFDGIVDSIPLIIFAYMYQVNIPCIYLEMEKRNLKTFAKVLSFGTTLAVLAYVVIGIFGYVTFVDNVEALMDKNILLAPYGNNVPILIVRPFANFIG